MLANIADVDQELTPKILYNNKFNKTEEMILS